MELLESNSNKNTNNESSNVNNMSNEDQNEQIEEESSDTFFKLKSLLDEKGVKYTLMEVNYKLSIIEFYKNYKHEPTKTSEESANVRGTTLESGAKALVLKHDKGFSIIIISAAKKFNNKAAKKLLKTKNLKFADLKDVKNITVNK
jgi:Ala-tRNA(Pro) deacylase